jgi:hypothetical protein
VANPEGRPPIEIDRANFEKLCAMCATQDEIAGFFECSPDTILRFCHDTYGETFAEVFKRYSAKRRVSLRRQQFEIAEKGNVTMQIWLGKQYLGQSDKQESVAEVNHTGGITVAAIDVRDRIKQIKGETE